MLYESSWQLHKRASARTVSAKRPVASEAALPSQAGLGTIVGFVVVALALQVGLFAFGNTPLRLPCRVAIYGISLAMLYYVPGRSRPHPAGWWAQVAVVFLLIGMLNPAGDRWIARLASVTLYASVLAPILWVGRLKLGPRDLRIVLRMLWAFYAISGIFGVLQVNYPGQFDGALSANYDDQSMVAQTLKLADGSRYVRPKGLTDTPGGAANAGANAVILGMGLLLTETHVLAKTILAAGMLAGLFCIYMCQERTNLIVIAIAVGSLLVVLLRRKAVNRAMGLLVACALIAVAGSAFAFNSGGNAVIDRFVTLVSEDPGTVYQKNRGQFLSEVIEQDLPDDPFGAGEGRWGMINVYFGTAQASRYAEMMWQSLAFDGGVPLVITYMGLFACLIWTAWLLAIRQKSSDLGCWAGVIFGYNLAALAGSFVYPILALETGMEVILLNACLFAACKFESQTQKLAACSVAQSQNYLPQN